jgi:hypothetical protein
VKIASPVLARGTRYFDKSEKWRQAQICTFSCSASFGKRTAWNTKKSSKMFLPTIVIEITRVFSLRICCGFIVQGVFEGEKLAAANFVLF